VESKEFSLIRHYLSKTQNELARLLCISIKAIQSYEEGWRNIPAGAERQLLLLLALKRASDETVRPCWEIKECPGEWRGKCSAWEYQAGHLCWFINGTFCRGECQDNWERKIEICRECAVFRAMVPPLI